MGPVGHNPSALVNSVVEILAMIVVSATDSDNSLEPRDVPSSLPQPPCPRPCGPLLRCLSRPRGAPLGSGAPPPRFPAVPRPSPEGDLRLQPPPSSTACPGRAVPCCGPLGRAAAARWGRVPRDAQAVVAGERWGHAAGGVARKCRLFFLSVRMDRYSVTVSEHLFARTENCLQGPLRHLNLGITLSVRIRMVFITTSRGTDDVQLTSNMISSALKSSRSM